MKTNETKPGRGGRREGAGRKAEEGAKRVVIFVRVTEQTKDRVCEVAKERGITPADLMREWASGL